MIFVTVGTHEQSFNRLIEKVDNLVFEGIIKDEVIIQKGYSTYEPKHCTSFDILPYQEMQNYFKIATIVITHGGPASFIEPISNGKIPIVVPRQKRFGEHINNHQLDFSLEISKREIPIIVIDDIDDLNKALLNYDTNSITSLAFNNDKFNVALKKEIEDMFNE